MTARRALPALLALLALLVTGCVNLPASGPVQAGPSVAGTDEAPYDYKPAGPWPKEPPVGIVTGFLVAMQASPHSTAVARQFLTAESRANWSPDAGTVIYDGQPRYSGTGTGEVTVHLKDTARLDAGGRWLGTPTRKGRLAFDLRLVKSNGQWRISNPPDVLIIPQTDFEFRFKQFNLYFFDQSGQVLVPEPVYLPTGDQAPTLLVRGLLHGPDQDVQGATRSFIPTRTRLTDLSVPVSQRGVATVSLNDPMLSLSTDERQLALAQLGWTLAQVPGLDRMRITVNGSPLEVAGEGTTPSVRSWSKYDPSVPWASQELFGLRDGHLVTVLNGVEHPVPGVFPAAAPPVRSIGVDLAAQSVAGVTEDGTSVIVGKTSGQVGLPGSQPQTRPAYTGGTDLLKPAWDFYGQLWLLDRTSAGAVVTVLRDRTPTNVRAPGITGEDVTAFSLSRDGTRLVAVIAGHGRRGDHLVVARVMRDHSGQVTSIGAGHDLPVTSAPVHQIRDLAWYTPTTVAVLVSVERRVGRLYLARVDGSSGFVDSATSAELFPHRASRVVTWPAPVPGPLYLTTPSQELYVLSPTGRWEQTGISGLVSPTFVG